MSNISMSHMTASTQMVSRTFFNSLRYVMCNFMASWQICPLPPPLSGEFKPNFIFFVSTLTLLSNNISTTLLLIMVKVKDPLSSRVFLIGISAVNCSRSPSVCCWTHLRVIILLGVRLVSGSLSNRMVAAIIPDV